MSSATREEQRRRQQRFARQSLGLVVVILVIVGIISIFNSGLRLIEKLTDNTDEMLAYQDLLRSMVLYDPAPFTSVEDVDSNTMHAVAVWGFIYETFDRDGSLDNLEHDPDTDCAIVPALDAEAFLTKLVGPDYALSRETFTDSAGLIYQYDEERQGYLIPVTSMEQSYTPRVVKLETRNGQQVVTVGYISTGMNATLTGVVSSDPQKYMEYIFTRSSSHTWYLSALQDSDMKVAAASSSSQSTAPMEEIQTDPNQAVQETIDADDTIEIADSSTASQPEEEASAEEEDSAEAEEPEEELQEDSGEEEES